MPFRLGVDVGGTFTDLVLAGPDGRALTRKVLSSTANYAEAILSGRKRIEVRTWRTAHRGPLYIHAGRTWYGTRDLGAERAYEAACALARRTGLIGWGIEAPERLPRPVPLRGSLGLFAVPFVSAVTD